MFFPTFPIIVRYCAWIVRIRYKCWKMRYSANHTKTNIYFPLFFLLFNDFFFSFYFYISCIKYSYALPFTFFSVVIANSTRCMHLLCFMIVACTRFKWYVWRLLLFCIYSNYVCRKATFTRIKVNGKFKTHIRYTTLLLHILYEIP